MKSLLMFFLFAGLIFIIQGIYEEKLKIACNNQRVEYKFIPRSYYEEQISNTNASASLIDMMDNTDKWSLYNNTETLGKMSS